MVFEQMSSKMEWNVRVCESQSDNNYLICWTVWFTEVYKVFTQINMRKNSPETRKKGSWEHLSTKYVAGPNEGVKRLRQKNTA